MWDLTFCVLQVFQCFTLSFSNSVFTPQRLGSHKSVNKLNSGRAFQAVLCWRCAASPSGFMSCAEWSERIEIRLQEPRHLDRPKKLCPHLHSPCLWYLPIINLRSHRGHLKNSFDAYECNWIPHWTQCPWCAVRMLAYARICVRLPTLCTHSRSPKGLIAFSNTGTDPCQTLIFRHSLTRWAKGRRHRRNRRKRRYETWRFDCMMQVPESSWWWLDPNSQMFLGEFDPSWSDHFAPFYIILTMMDWWILMDRGPGDHWCHRGHDANSFVSQVWGAYAGVSRDVAPFSWSSPGCHFVSCRAGAMFILEAAALSFAHPAGDWCLNCGSRQEMEKRKSTIKKARGGRCFSFLSWR